MNRPILHLPPKKREGDKSPRHVGRALVAPGNAPTPGAPADTEEAGRELPLPHERDESTGQAEGKRDPMVEQAARDLAAGQVDTDLRGTPGLDAERRRRLVQGGG